MAKIFGFLGALVVGAGFLLFAFSDLVLSLVANNPALLQGVQMFLDLIH